VSGTVPVTDRVTLTVGGFVFALFSEVSIERDLQQIAGRFRVKCVDMVRLARALPYFIGQPPDGPELKAGLACELALDGDPVLIGWLDKPHFKWSATAIEADFTGRDRTGDLVDCAALPNGPAEFHGVDLLHVANVVCAPFGIPVRADVDIGAPFDNLALHPHQTGMELLESATRQRSVLLTSDGVGGLLLTQGGKTRAPAALRMGENIQDADAEFDWSKRFSDYFVKGQTTKNRSGTAAPLDSSVVPLSGAPTPPATPGPASTSEAASIVMTGHAIDPEITRWRPTVRLTRTQSGMSTAQEQAEWALRVARGQSEKLEYEVLDWRDGPSRGLWLPNQVTAVWDPYAGIDKDMLIAGCEYRFGADGIKTRLRLVGVTAYDRINEAERKRSRASGRAKAKGPAQGPLTSTVTPLSAA
jgi:prophage tail gpP-like protein